jgi:hypothetical protein
METKYKEKQSPKKRITFDYDKWNHFVRYIKKLYDKSGKDGTKSVIVLPFEQGIVASGNPDDAGIFIIGEIQKTAH